jgi:hypothetical protein
MDVVLFSNVELPVFIPENIVESQKALMKKSVSPTKKKQAQQAAAAVAQASSEGAGSDVVNLQASQDSKTLRLSPEKIPIPSKGSSSNSPTGRKFRSSNNRTLNELINPNSQRKMLLSQAQIDKRLQYLLLDTDDQKRDIFNSISRI